MKTTGAEIIIQFLEEKGIRVIAGIPGGSNLPMYNALYNSSIRHVLARHEQGAAYIAQGMARTTGKAAVCFATSGPGAANLVTAIADARMDSVPIVAITGQVPSGLIGTDAFQEVDIISMTQAITKRNYFVSCVEDLPSILNEAFYTAENGRPGPVLIDVPKDIQMASIELPDGAVCFDRAKSESTMDIDNQEKVRMMARMINQSQRPILYVGGGMMHSTTHNILNTMAERNSIPIVTSLMGLGSIPADHFLNLGMLGMHGARSTHFIMRESDLIIALGVRFDDRATGKVKEFCPNARIIHVDIDSREINKIKKADLSIVSAIDPVMWQLMSLIEPNNRREWMYTVGMLRSQYQEAINTNDSNYEPSLIIKSIASMVSDTAIVTTDVGQHQMWVAQYYPFKKPRKFLTSGGLGTMGFGLPVAIGAAIANPGKQVICFSGDGSILMNIQELATLNDLNLNVKIILFNNGHLGLVRQQQELFYDKNYIASRFYRTSNYTEIAKGFGIRAIDLTNIADPMNMIERELSMPGPALINVPIMHDEMVSPMVPPGAANHEAIEVIAVNKTL